MHISNSGYESLKLCFIEKLRTSYHSNKIKNQEIGPYFEEFGVTFLRVSDLSWSLTLQIFGEFLSATDWSLLSHKKGDFLN